MNEEDTGISKRQLGIVMVLGGAVGFFAVLAIDIVDAGRLGGIGPLQTLALLLMVAVLIIGLTLIPLGDAPA